MTVSLSLRMRARTAILMLATVLSVSACSEIELASHVIKKATWSGAQETTGSYKVGNPYTVSGVRYYPQESFSMVETGIASWYGPNFHGKRTANGEIYNQNDLTAAHRTLQMPSIVRVTNLENGKSVVLRVNDRGPFKRGRVIDVSKRGAELLGFIGNGTARVRVEVLEKESRQIAEAAKRGVNTAGMNVQQAAAPAPAQTSPAVTPVSTRVASSGSRSNNNQAYLRNDAEALPESLRTPTITVEELTAPGARNARGWGNEQPAARQPEVQTQPAAPAARETTPAATTFNAEQKTASVPMAQGHLKDGRFLPDPVVTREAVRPTGIFVQAGSFSVQDNAVRLGKKLETLGNVDVSPVSVSGRQFWRVRIGPLASVEEADRVLDAAIRAGGDGAKVMRH
ncbi:MAG: septal ring lytic transglycosylase RlpA family protein [Bdellovibrionales bacterium]|nr:septal ring lytic transglycosylase RlpA family protein [Bdellovibrionales bacterium]